MRYFLFALSIVLIAGCSSGRKTGGKKTSVEIKEIKFLGEHTVPNGLLFKNTVVGGLSGIDYDAKRNLYYMICDDPSANNPARFYTAQILISERGIDSVIFTEVDYFAGQGRQPYPDIQERSDSLG